MQFGACPWEVVWVHDDVAAADVDIVLKHKGDRLRAEGFVQRPVKGPDFLHRATEAAGQHLRDQKAKP